MTFIDYFLIAIVLVLFLFAIIYLIKNKGCPSSTCTNCKYREDCHKKHNKKGQYIQKGNLLSFYYKQGYSISFSKDSITSSLVLN